MMITRLNYLKIFSVMITDWDKSSTDSEAKITNLKLMKGALKAKWFGNFVDYFSNLAKAMLEIFQSVIML